MSPHFLYTASFKDASDVSPSATWEPGDIDLNVDDPVETPRRYPTLADPSFHAVTTSGISSAEHTLGHSQLWFPVYQPRMSLKLRTYHDVVHRAQALKKDLDGTANVGETVSTLRQARDLLKNNQSLIMNVATAHGKSPLLARKRLADRLHQRIRDIATNKEILKKLFTPVGQKKPVAAFGEIWSEYLAALKNQGAEKEAALQLWQEKLENAFKLWKEKLGKLDLDELDLDELDLGDDWQEVQDVYSIAITMPLKEWNHVCDTAGTRLIDIQYKITREFLRADSSPDEFLDTFRASRFIEEAPETDTTVVNGTVVNGTLIGVQSHSVARLPELLENLPRFVPAILKKLLERRAELSSLIKNLEVINTADDECSELLNKAREEWDANLQITDQFTLTPEGQIVFHNVGWDVCNLTPIPLEKFVLDKSYAGVAVYQGEEDVPVRRDQKHNQTYMNTLVQRLRDQAVQFAEGITHVALGVDVSAADRVSFTDPSGIMNNKRVFREGSLLSRRQILSAIMDIASRPADVIKLQEASRQFHIMNLKELKEAAIAVAKMVASHAKSGKSFTYPLGFAVSETDDAALARKWIAALDEEQFSSPNMGEFLSAWQWAFLQPVTAPQIRAFYIQAGGFPEPSRVLRFLTNTQPGSLRALMNEAIEVLEKAEEDGTDLSYDFEELLARIRQLFEHGVTLMEQAQINPRDGLTIANFEELAPQARSVFTAFYRKMQDEGVILQGPPPGLIIFGAEMQSAKVLDSEVNPILEDHMMDANMILIRIATQIAVENFNTWLSVHEGPGVHVDVAEWARGDEKVFALPRHLNNGKPITEALLSQFARIHREVLAKLLPYSLHLEKKIELDDKNVLRLKRWKITDARGRKLKVASAKENATAKSGPVWILAINGKVLKPAILRDWSTLGKGESPKGEVTKEMGQVDMRLVAVSLDLKIGNFNTFFTRSATLVMEKDKDVKDQEYEGKIPTQGVWWIESDTGELRQIL